jgi:RHS repeat-associated protein
VPVSQDTLVWVAIASENKVELVDQSTGAIVGTPISLPSGSDPVALAYWAPSAANQYTLAENKDPYVLVADHGTDKVSFIDAATKQYVTSISLGGDAPTTMSIAVSTTSDFAAVTDNTTGGHSRVSMIEVPGQEVFQTFPNVASTTNALGQIIFDASGNWAYVTAPAAHQVHAFNCGAYTCSAQTTLTGSSAFDPVGLATDWTTPSSATLYVTSDSSTGQNLRSWADDGATWGSGTTIASFGVAPGALSISAGAQVAYVSLPSDSEVEAYSLSALSVLGYETGIKPGPMALSWDSGTLLAGDTTSGSDELGLAHTSAFGSTFAETAMAGQVSAIAVPVAAYIYYDIVAITDGLNGYINVIDSATGAIIEQWYDANTPEAVVASPNGQVVYVVDATGGGTSGTEPEVNVLSTADFGTATDPITAVYPIAQSATTPWSYSLAHAPVPKSIAISPNGDSLLITDSANSDVLAVDFSVPDGGGAWEGAVTSIASLNGSTAETPTSITYSPDGSYAYVTSHPSSGAGGITVLSYAFTAHGTLTYVAYQAGSSFAADPTTESATTLVDPLSIILASDDRSAYVLDGDSSEPLLDQFATTTDGTLATTSTNALPAGTAPVSFSMSPEDNVAYVSDSSTDKTTAIDLTSDSSTFGDSLYAETQEGTAGLTGSTPDGQYFATGNGPTSDDGIEIGSTGNGAALEFVTLPSQPVGMAISPVSSSQWLSTSLVYAGGLSGLEELGGASNPSESAMSSIAHVNSAGTPSDAHGVSAGTDTALHSYTLSLTSFSLPEVGLPLDVTATYDSAYIAYGIDTSSSIPSFAFGWRLSTGITWTQNPDSGFFPCRITVTQADGSEIYFEPAQAIFSSCTGLTYEPLPWEQAALVLSTSTCSGSDYCWIVSDTETGEQFYMDSNASSSHQLVKEVDRNGNTISFTYTSGKLSSEGGAGGRSISFSYPSAGTSPCPSMFNGQTIAKCVVATDPLGRAAIYMLAGSSSTGYDLEGVTMAAPTGWSTPSATYAFSYSSHYLTSWWDPNNYAGYAGNTTEATDVMYGAGHFVSEVTGPEVTDEGTAMDQTYTPTTTYSYPLFDPFSGSGTVITTDANANYDIENSASLPGANVTLENYQNWMLSATVQGYGPTDASLPDSMSSNTITTQRDPFTLMPVETINPLADTTTSSSAVTDLGISFSTYDVDANLIAVTSPGDSPDSWVTSQFVYNQFNEPLESTNALGEPTSLTYDSAGNMTSASTPPTEPWYAPSVTQYLYDSEGQVCATLSPDGSALSESFASSSCTYDTQSSLPSQYVTTYTYNTAGDELSSMDPLGNVSSTLFDSDGNPCATLSPNGYAAGDRLPSSCPSSGVANETISTGDTVFNSPQTKLSPTNVTNAAGRTTSTTCYDSNGNIVASISSMGAQIACSSVSLSSPATYTSYYSFNQDGEPTSITAPGPSSGVTGATTSTYYDPDGNVVATVTPNGNESTSTNDNMGDVVSATDTSGTTSTATFDPTGNPITSTTPGISGSGTTYHLTTTSTYSPAGDVSQTSEPDPTGGSGSLVTQNSFDGEGNQLSASSNQTNAGSSSPVGTAEAQTPSGLACWTSSVPYSGTPTCDSPPTGTGSETTQDFYDANGNLVAVTGSSGSFWTWNPATDSGSGCNATTTSTCADTTYYQFNQADQEIAMTTPANPLGTTPSTEYYFDSDGNQVAVMGPSGDPASCNPITSSTCAGTTYSQYDGWDRLVAKSYTDGTLGSTTTYNSDGTVASVMQGSGGSATTTSYSYDPLGQVTSIANGAGVTTSYAYDISGNLVCISYPSATQACSSDTADDLGVTGLVVYSYDSMGQMSSSTDWLGNALTYAYDGNGDVCAISTTSSVTSCGVVPTSGVTTNLTYNDADNLTNSATTASGSNLLSLSYTWDGNGNLWTSQPTVGTSTLATDDYAYNQQNQLTSGPVTSAEAGASYAYTPDGGMVSAPAFSDAGYSASGQVCWIATTGTSNVCSGTGLPPTGATTFQYDASGDQTGTSAGNSQGWSQEAEQLCWSSPGTSGSSACSAAPTGATTYQYDSTGLRTGEDLSGTTQVTFTWDLSNDQLLSDGTWDFVYGPDASAPVEQIATSGGSSAVVDLLVSDQVGNTRGLVRIGGPSLVDTLTNYTDYDAYGNAITASGGSVELGGISTPQTGLNSDYVDSSPIGFGQGYTDASGLIYLVNRYYDPIIGQFISIDPSLQSTQAPYAYAGNEPSMATDPLGLRFYYINHRWVKYSGKSTMFNFLCTAKQLQPSEEKTARCRNNVAYAKWAASHVFKGTAEGGVGCGHRNTITVELVLDQGDISIARWNDFITGLQGARHEIRGVYLQNLGSNTISINYTNDTGNALGNFAITESKFAKGTTYAGWIFTINDDVQQYGNTWGALVGLGDIVGGTAVGTAAADAAAAGVDYLADALIGSAICGGPEDGVGLICAGAAVLAAWAGDKIWNWVYHDTINWFVKEV